jgi:hypothetical protein
MGRPQAWVPQGVVSELLCNISCGLHPDCFTNNRSCNPHKHVHANITTKCCMTALAVGRCTGDCHP